MIVAALAAASFAAHADPSTLDSAWGSVGTVALPVGRVVTRVMAQADGATIAIVENNPVVVADDAQAFVVRLTPSGQVDATFGSGGAIAFACRIGSGTCAPRVAVDAQQRIWIAARLGGSQPADLEVRRFLSDGTPDVAFGPGGTQVVRGDATCTGIVCPFTADDHLSLTAMPDGRALLVVECGLGAPNAVDLGTCLITLDNSGAVAAVRAYQGFFQSIPIAAPALLPDGRVVLAGASADRETGRHVPALLRLAANGDADTGFGSQGVAVVARDDFFRSRQVAAFADGSALLVLNDTATTLVRITAAGALDTSWISGGIFRSTSFSTSAVLAAADGSALLAGTLSSQAAVMRLRPDGTFDSRFAGAGIAAYPFAGGSSAKSLALHADGRITVGGNTNVGIVLRPGPKPGFPPIAVAIPAPFAFRIVGGIAPVDHPWLEPSAVEYRHRQFGHYFVTANGDEMQALDLASDAPWVRTGQQFRVWGQSAPELAVVCRFWSDQSFAPRSSHVYTPFADECQTLRAGSVWRYEGTAFWLRMPEGVAGARWCPAGATALYRAYNSGEGGAPNHRYTTDRAILDAMVARGWTIEGDGITGVFACTAP